MPSDQTILYAMAQRGGGFNVWYFIKHLRSNRLGSFTPPAKEGGGEGPETFGSVVDRNYPTDYQDFTRLSNGNKVEVYPDNM